MARVIKKYRKVNVENARVARARGVSYAEIAQMQRVSPTAVYYALNPRAKVRERKSATAKTGSLYFEVELWAALSERARVEGTTTSQLAAAILEGRAPSLRVSDPPREDEDE